jgi:hypothetical protein
MGLGKYVPSPPDPHARKLAGEIDGWIAKIMEMTHNLPKFGEPAATQETYEGYYDHLTDIGIKLKSYIEQVNHPYYKLFERSTGSQIAAKRVIEEAKKTAERFERFYIEPDTYRKTTSTFDLNDLLNALINLRGFFQA